MDIKGLLFSLFKPPAPAGSVNLPVQVDVNGPNTTVSVSAPLATSSAPGLAQADGTSITASGGIISAPIGGVSTKTANYTAVAGDMGKLLVFNSAGAVTLTLPAAPPSAQWWIAVQNIGAGALTINRNSLNIDGAAANLTLAQNSGCDIFTDGTNYFTERGAGAVTSLTTTGTSGPATLSGGVLNVPQYSGGGGGSLPAYIQPSTAVPAVASLTAVNQSTSTAVDSAAGIFMHQPTGATQFLFALLQNAIATPWTFTAALIPVVSQFNYTQMGLCFSDGTKFVTCGVGYNKDFSPATKFLSSKWTNATTYSADYTFSPSPYPYPSITAPAVLWLRLVDDGTNRKFLYSMDGVNFILIHSVGRTDFLTCTKIGIYTDCQNASVDAYMTCSSWLVTTP